MPDAQQFVLPPEMINVDNFMDVKKPKSTHATFLTDGDLLQTPEQQVTWVTRNLLCMSQYFLNQLPPSYDVRVNPDLFMNSISYVEDAERHTPNLWDLAPGYRTHENEIPSPHHGFVVEQKTRRIKAQSEWEEYFHKMSGHMPIMVANKTVPPLHEEDPPQTSIPGGNNERTSGGGKGRQRKQQEPKTGGKVVSTTQKRKKPPTTTGGSSKRVRRDGILRENTDQSGPSKGWNSGNFSRFMLSAEGIVPESSESEVLAQTLKTRFLEKFLHDLKLPVLANEAERVAIACQMALEGVTSEVSQLLSKLDHIYDLIVGQPTSAQAASEMPHIWEGIKALKQTSGCAEITSCWEHASIMGSTYAAWYWLDVVVANACDAIVTTGDTTAAGGRLSWLARLTNDVTNVHITRTQSKEYCPADFLDGLDGPSFTFRHPRGMVIDVSHNPRPIINAVLDIIRCWLGYPNEESQFQAWFIHCIISAFGRKALLLNSVWVVFQRITRSSLLPRKVEAPALSDLQPIVELFRAQPLANRDSPEYAMLKEISDSMRAVQSPSTDEDSQDTTSFHQRLLDFENMLLQSYDVLSNSLSSSESRWQEKLQDDPNRLMPFREHIPSRVHFSGADGPFGPKYKRTQAGMLSALIWRGVTFGTEFSEIEAQQVFQGAEDFEKAMARHSDEEATYFCDPNAFGQWSSRTPDHVKTYEESLNLRPWESFVGDRMVPFTECFEWFQASDTNDAKFFPQIGPLGAYLLTCDFVYAGVVDAPSNRDMAVVIGQMNKGAISGLRLLGLLSRHDSPRDIDAVTRALERATELIQGWFSDEERTEIVFDIIMVENSLCKFSRAFKQGWLRREGKKHT